MIPKEAISNNRSFANPGKRKEPTKKGKTPLEKSKRNEIKPNRTPKILVIFVAPIFPLPSLRTFIFLIFKASQYPKGMDPYKYVIKQKRISLYSIGSLLQLL